MTVAIWSLAALGALVLRRGIRWHLQRWLPAHLRSFRVPALQTRRLLVDPLVSIIPSRRLFT